MKQKKNRVTHENLKVMTNYRNIKPARTLDDVIEETIGELGNTIKVESANITVERSTSVHPPVITRIFIETPGPDIEVEARDYTSAAAYNKAWRELQRRAGLKASRAGNRNRSTPKAERLNRQRTQY